MKPVLAEAMRDLLPECIRNRRYKGHFNEVYYLGLARNVPSLERMIREAPLDDLEMFDTGNLIQSLQEASFAGVNPRQLQRLDFTLALIKWLGMHEAWQRTQEPATQTIKVQRHDGSRVSASGGPEVP
jgi:asparagine synthase (glutamine-hydrolysing)